MAGQRELPVRQDDFLRPGASRHPWIAAGTHKGATGIDSAAAASSQVPGSESDRATNLAPDQPIHVQLSASLVPVGNLLALPHTEPPSFRPADWPDPTHHPPRPWPRTRH